MTKKKALVIVDVQNDFCPNGALPAPNGNEVVEPLNKMIEYASENRWAIMASRDYHPPKTSHFKEYGGDWPVHCVKDTIGAEFHHGLYLLEAIIISKGTGENENAYSAFNGRGDGPNGWNGMKLKHILKALGVTSLYIGGLATDYCVKETVLDAIKEGFETYLLEDACRAVNINPDDGEKAIAEMETAGAIRTTTTEIINERE